MGIVFSVLAAMVAVLIGLTQAADARTRALIAGVSGYPALNENLHLQGPRNDARELANALVSFGIAPRDLTVLADGVEGLAEGIAAPGLPTRDAILSALADLAEESAPGDLVFFYFSGHGSQQPDRDGDELGGADGIFLPYDAAAWTGGGVKNAIVDDELREAVERILDRGVDFFGVIDACHSATGFRTIADDGVRARQVSPADLGIPENAFIPQARAGAGMRAAPLVGSAPSEGRGRAAYFYAAQETEVALERQPRGAEAGEVYGVFTFTMLSRLNRDPAITYRTLHEAVVSDIKRGTLMATQTPELEGDMLDEPVLRLSQAPALRQWPVRAGKLQAGRLNGLSDGALLALYDDAAAADDAAIAHAAIETAGAAQSAIAPAEGSDPALLRKARYARLVEPGIDLKVSLSNPIRIDPGDGLDYSTALTAFQTALASPLLGARISTRDSGYDVAVGLVDGTLAFAPAGGMIDGSSPRLTLPGAPHEAAGAVASAIERIARATALYRLAGAADGDDAMGLSSHLLVTSPLEPVMAGMECPDPFGPLYGEPQQARGPPALQDCDMVSLVLRNTAPRPLDATVLWIGADFAITPLWPDGGISNRIHPSQARTLPPLIRIEPDEDSFPRGEERIVVIAVPGAGRSHITFDSFAQEGVRRLPGEEIDAAQEAARALIAAGLNDMQAQSTRQPPRLQEDISIEILPFHAAAGGGE